MPKPVSAVARLSLPGKFWAGLDRSNFNQTLHETFLPDLAQKVLITGTPPASFVDPDQPDPARKNVSGPCLICFHADPARKKLNGSA